MDLFPLARRVLLTAYADTDAAIEAINVVDLDHYLLKPWDPPEEKLYPVVDALLDAWTATRPAAAPGDPGHRAPLVGPLVRGPRLPGPQPGAVPLVPRRRRRRASRLLAAAGLGRRPAAAWWSPPTARRWSRRPTPSWPRTSGWPPPRPPTSTTWSWSAAARPASARRSTAASEGLRTVLVERQATGGQAGTAAGSRTTSASPTASPAPS